MRASILATPSSVVNLRLVSGILETGGFASGVGEAAARSANNARLASFSCILPVQNKADRREGADGLLEA